MTDPTTQGRSSVSYISSMVRRAIDQACEMGEIDFCITIEAKSDGMRWMQITGLKLNLAYPFRDEPLARLRGLSVSLPEQLELSEWEPGISVTFDHAAEAESLGVFAGLYMQKVLGVADSEELFTTTEELL